MSRLCQSLAVVVVLALVGCGSSSSDPLKPLDLTPEVEAKIKAEDAEVHDAELAHQKQQQKKK